MNRAENVLKFRRIHMHGTKTGPNADPDYGSKYHPAVGSIEGSEKNAFGLKRGKNKVKVQPASKTDPYLSWVTDGDDPDRWIDVWLNPTEKELKRLDDPDSTWGVELRFMVDRNTGDLIAWESTTAFHTQVTQSLLGIQAWKANNNGEFDLWSDYTISASEFYEALINLKDLGEFDQPDWSDDTKDKVVMPKIIRGKR